MGDLSQDFSRSEFRCGGKDGSDCSVNCGFDTVDIELIRVLQKIRGHFDRPVTINCGCRCKVHNAEIKPRGSKKSQHLYGRAADIVVEMVPTNIVYDFLNETYPDKYGIGSYNSFTHIDTRSAKARW